MVAFAFVTTVCMYAHNARCCLHSVRLPTEVSIFLSVHPLTCSNSLTSGIWGGFRPRYYLQKTQELRVEIQQLKAKNHGLKTQMDALALDHERLAGLLAAAEKVQFHILHTFSERLERKSSRQKSTSMNRYS